MKKTPFILFLALLAVTALADEKRFTVPIDDSPAIGPSDAQVVIIEFLDFQ